jgi:cell division protein FtsQ
VTKINKSGEYGKYILENKEAILRKKKKRRAIKRSIVAISIMTIILITLCFNLPYFNISSIKVDGNKNVTSEEILNLSELKSGTNIFKFIVSKTRKSVLRNPYVLNVDVSRKIPNTVVLKVSERNATFYVSYNESFYVIDNNLIVLEKRSTIEGMHLLKLDDIDMATAEIGKALAIEDQNKKKALVELSDFLSEHNILNDFEIKAIKLNDFKDITLYVNNAYIKLGTSEDVKGKLTKAFSILRDEKFNGLKGYIDVSFKGNPVIYKEE